MHLSSQNDKTMLYKNPFLIIRIKGFFVFLIRRLEVIRNRLGETLIISLQSIVTPLTYS